MRQFSIFQGPEGVVLQRFIEATQKKFETEAVNLGNYVGGQIRDLWRKMAIGLARHEGWGRKYAAAIQFEPASKGSGRARVWADVAADDKTTRVSNAIWVGIVEKGIKSWSIRDALLASKRVKRSRDGGRYIIVPFRWRTPAGYKKSSEVFTGTMSKDIYKIVKTGVRLKGEEYGHMEGMQRYGGSLHGQYFTFRVVSDKTPTSAWQYPETPGTPVFEKVRAKVSGLIAATISDYIRGFVEDAKKGGIA